MVPSGLLKYLVATVLMLPAVDGTFAIAQQATHVRVVTTSAVLAQPRGDAEAVATLNAGQILEVLDERDGWYLVRPPETSGSWRTGWVSQATVTPVTRNGQLPQRMPAQAPDPSTANRKGFIVGLGAGVGTHRTTDTLFDSSRRAFEDVTSNEFAIVTDFRIGYAPSDNVLLHYSNKVAWTRHPRYDVVGLSGFGVTYMFRKSSPSPFLTGAVGIGVGGTVDGNDAVTGSGFSIGGGYEFSRRWSVDAEALFVRLGDADRHTVLKAGISWLFY